MTAAAPARSSRESYIACGAMVLSAACWGLATVMSKGALAHIPPFSLLFLQLSASVAFLWGTFAVTRSRLFLDRPARRAAATGVVEPGLSYGVGVPGLALTGAANASVISAAEPAFIVLLAWLVLRQRPAAPLFAAVLLAAVGVALLTLTDASDLGSGPLLGDLLVLLGTLFAALYVLASQRFVASIPPLPLAALQQSAGWIFASALLAGAVALGYERLSGVPPPSVLALALLSGVVQYALAFWFYLRGLRTLPAGIAGLFLALAPVFGVSGAMLFLGEPVRGMQWVGALLVVGAILVAARRATG